MSPTNPDAVAERVRREPPRFRRVTVARAEPLTPHLVRVTLLGPELDGLHIDEPCASVRLLLPTPGSSTLMMPTWAGNEFLLPDGSRAVIRTFTPGRIDATASSLELDVVLHHHGVASDWARTAAPGDPAAISGPGRGYVIDPDASDYLIGGDETAVPAIRQLLEALPAGMSARVFIEVAAPDARVTLPSAPGMVITWLDAFADSFAVSAPRSTPGAALVDTITNTEVGSDTRVWVAGEAAAVQRIRRHLFAQPGFDRARATVRGYWKRGRGETPVD